MGAVMIYLKEVLTFLEAGWWAILYGVIVFMNPVAMLPQLFSVLTTRKIEGLSLSMFLIFVSIQTAVALGAIRALDWSLFVSMTVSAVETSVIVVMVIKIRYFKRATMVQ